MTLCVHGERMEAVIRPPAAEIAISPPPLVVFDANVGSHTRTARSKLLPEERDTQGPCRNAARIAKLGHKSIVARTRSLAVQRQRDQGMAGAGGRIVAGTGKTAIGRSGPLGRGSSDIFRG